MIREVTCGRCGYQWYTKTLRDVTCCSKCRYNTRISPITIGDNPTSIIPSPSLPKPFVVGSVGKVVNIKPDITTTPPVGIAHSTDGFIVNEKPTIKKKVVRL